MVQLLRSVGVVDVQTQVSLIFPVEGLEVSVLVSREGEGLYRLREHPMFSVSASYGDLIRCREVDEKRIELLEIVEASELVAIHCVLSQAAIESAQVACVLAKVLESGGYWQRDFGGCLSIFFHPDRYDPRQDFEFARA